MEAEVRLKGPFGIESAKPAKTLTGTNFLLIGDRMMNIRHARSGLDVWITYEGKVAKYTLAEGASDEAGKEAVAPMTGKVVAIPVEVGQKVKEGDTLAILEAMKMEYRLEAEADGEIAEISAEVGELVDLGHVLVRLK
jgi:biotin carboxyl carrier protein